MNPKRVKRLLCLDLAPHQLTLIDLQRVGGTRWKARQIVAAPLILDPFSAAPELMAREFENLLAHAGLKPAPCLVCLPASRILSHSIEIPAIDEADVASFLELESEHTFPFPPEDLRVATTRYTDPLGAKRATFYAIPKTHLDALERGLRLAGLHAVSMTVGTAAVADITEGVEAVLALTASGIELLVAVGAQPALVRMLAEPSSPDRTEFTVNSLAREMRITLGALPTHERDSLRRVLLADFGAHESLRQELQTEFEAARLQFEPVQLQRQEQWNTSTGQQPPTGMMLATSRWLATGHSILEFLPPRTRAMRVLARRLSAGGLAWKLLGGAAAIGLLTIVAVVWQHWRLHQLDQRWGMMAPEVARLNEKQQNIRNFRPWFDNRIHSLEIARALTRVFPEDGSVWTRSLEIKDAQFVECTGYAATNADWLRTLDLLRQRQGVTHLQLGQVRGESPVQFSLTYQWQGEGGAGDGD